MALFFNGRSIVTPTTVSRVDDSAMANRATAVGNKLLILGSSAGGRPKTALRFGKPSEAQAALVSGPGLDAVLRAFNPSAETGGPAEIVFIRVDPATRSALGLLDAGAAAAIDLVSTDYGLRTAQVKVKVEPATTRGLKMTTQFGNSYYSEDNVHRDALSLRYTGAALTATVTVDNTTLTLHAPAGTVAAAIDLATYPTVQQLVDRINTVPGFAAVVLEGNGAAATANALDGVAGIDVKTADYVVRADLAAAVDWFNGNSEGYVTATRPAAATRPPAAIPFTYLAGGVDGAPTNTDWSDSFTVAQSADVQWVVAASSAASIHAMTDAHCAYMANVAQRERRGFAGTPLGTTDDAALTAAKALNSDRISLVHLGGYDFDERGALKLYEPYVVAAMIAGGFAGSSPGTAMTNKSLKLRGIERKLRNPTDTDRLINGGVLCVEETDAGYRVVKSITTWLNDRNFNKVEVSTGAALDFTARTLREAVDPLRGQKGGPILIARAIANAESALKELATAEPVGPGILVGDDKSPAFRNLEASFEGDVLRVSVQASPVIPANYGAVVIYAVPYSGQAAA